MKKVRFLMIVFAVMFFVPLALQARTWVAGFLRDNSGAIVVTCRNGVSSDTWNGGFRRDQNGALDVAGNCTGSSSTPSPTPVPSATPTPLVQAYNPSYIYQGPASGGGGGNDCGGALCITGPMMQNLNIQYNESVGVLSGTFFNNGPNSCNNGQYCVAIYYNTLGDMGCASGTEFPLQYNAWDANDSTYPGTDPDFLHDATPPTGTNWSQYRDGQYNGRGFTYTAPNVCSNNTKGIWINPGNPNNDVSTAITNNWFANPSYINSNTHVCTRWDNSYIDDTTNEYGGKTFAALDAYINDLSTLYASFPYCQMFNNMAHGAGPWVWNNPGSTGSSGNIAFACNNGVCNDADDWCNNATTNFEGFQFERSITSGLTAGVGMLQNDLPYVLDTLSHIYTAPSTNPCTNVQPIYLDATAYQGTDDRYFRDDSLAQRLLSLRGNWTQSMAGVIEQRYGDCSGCTNQVTVFPEDNIVAFPLDSGMTRSAMSSSGDGNGCSTGDSGGAASFVVACIGTDLNGKKGAIFSRAFSIFINGTYNGVGVLLVNQSNQNQTVQDGWCKIDGLTQNCSSYPMFWQYKGTGPQTCYNDLGSNLGGSNATCTLPANTICPAANGCQGAAGEVATTNPIPGESIPMTLGFCAGGTTVQTADCMMLLLAK